MNLFKKIYYYYTFIRPLAFVGIFLICISASLIAINTEPYVFYNWVYILFGAFSCALLASASHTLNNIYDLEIDKINKPFRVLPSKKISLKEAWIITLIIYLLSFTLAWSINITFFIVILIMSFCTVIYSYPLFNLKKYGFIANINIAIPRGLLIVIAGWTVIKGIDYILPWYIGSISFLFLIGAITTKDIADIRGDKENNCLTLPVKYGLNKTIKIITPFFILPFFLIPLGVYLGVLKVYTLPLALLAVYGTYIIWLIKKNPNKLTGIEKNHISWKHTYILYMIFQIGICVAYII